MPWTDIPWTVLISSFFGGIISAYLAHREGKKPLPWFFIGLFFGVFGLFFFFNVLAKKNSAPKAKLGTKLEPQPYIFGPSDKFWYFLDEEHKQVGPMSYRALVDHWKQEKIKLSTFVWHEDLADWKPLGDLIRIEKVLYCEAMKKA